MPPITLLTGATGHVGTALLPRMLGRPDARVLALVRAKDGAHLAARRDRLVAQAGLDADQAGRLELVAGDVAAPGLGLADRAKVVGRVDRILHSAASVRFDMETDEAARQNIQSTTELLALAREIGRLARYDHVSTAYVAGDRFGRVTEQELDEGQGFRNRYEWSKCQAEKAVRAAMAEGLPAAVHRPSIIVGDSQTGETRSFNVLYWPLKLYVRGWWRTFPGSLEALVDVVPVDFVADAIVRLSGDPASLGETVHLAAGDGAPTVGAIMEAVRGWTGGPPLRVVDQGRYRRFVRPLLWPLFQTRRGRAIKRGGDAFMPYFTANPLFDTSRARALLGELEPPPVLAYLERVVRFAMARDFGG